MDIKRGGLIMNFFNLFIGAMFGGDIAGMREDNYEDRKIDRINPENNNGIGVSTVYASDVNQYETALLDAFGAHPVKRYRTMEEAQEGHKKWVKFANSGHGKKITVIGIQYDDCDVDNEEIVLEKVECQNTTST